MNIGTKHALSVLSFVLLGGCLHQTSTITSSVTGWDTGYMETSGGDGANKKLGMQIKYVYFQRSDGSCAWEVDYHLQSRDRGALGWHFSTQLYSVYYTFSYSDYSGTHLQTNTLNLIGQSDASGTFFTGTSPSVAGLPVFSNKHVVGQRYGGSSGIYLNW